jgi:biopolymer transport protein TolR
MPKVQATAAIGAGRMGRGRRISSTLSEINVVPLVDVMLVLLIIFMVTAPMLQRGIDVKLPQSSTAKSVEGDRVWVTVPLRYRQDQILYLDEEPLTAKVLQERVRQLVEGRTDKQVYLRGDGGVQLQSLMDVMDLLKNAGVQTVGLVTQPPERR